MAIEPVHGWCLTDQNSVQKTVQTCLQHLWSPDNTLDARLFDVEKTIQYFYVCYSMAGILNAIYVILAVGIGVVGLATVLQRVSGSERGGSKWVELSAIFLAALFVFVLGVEFLL